MKKIVASFIALLVSSMTLFAERVSRDDAALVANNFMNVRASSSAVKKAVPGKRMVLKAAAEENQYFVYENENGEGWVIVAANDAVSPILAYSETGRFRTENMPENVSNWMGKYNRFIQKIEEDGVVADEQTAAEWSALRRAAMVDYGTVVVGPLVKTTWDQEKPYNNLCPGSSRNRAMTGCVATAMAQVMYFWQWPKQGKGSLTYQPLDPNSQDYVASSYPEQSADFGATTYDWENMKKDYSKSYMNAQAKAVATLMYHCGVGTQMMYGSYNDGGSGTMTVNYGDFEWGLTDTGEGGCAQNAFFAFFRYKQPTGYMRDGYKAYGTTYYKSWTDAKWTAMIKEELDKQHPIMYGGASSAGGHSFICDGYTDKDYFHFNWGWSGENDGYYKLSKLSPGSGGAGGGDYEFSEDQDVLIGIEPDFTQGFEDVTVSDAAVKRLYNGQVVVIRDNKTYNMLGKIIE